MRDGVDVINEELDSQLSAMFDGELPGAQCELLSRRLVREESLRTRWGRYALIGAVVRAEPVSGTRRDFARRVSAAIVADAAAPVRRAAGGRRAAWQFGVGGALVASVAAVSVLLLRQQAAPLADVVVIAPAAVGAPTLAANAPARPAPAAVIAGPASREPASYVVPPASSGGRLAPPVELASFVVAHSAYSSLLVRRNLLSALVSGDAAELHKPAAPAPAGNASADAADGKPAP
jgi:negative regulator of sigma E activity